MKVFKIDCFWCGLFILSFVVFSSSLKAQTFKAAQQYTINRAAVVMIKTEVSATVYVSQVTINNVAFNHLLDSIKRLELDSIFLTPQQKLDVVLQEINNRPRRYFKNTFSSFRHHQSVSASGSGFIITGNGYVVTNCHVVDEDDAYIRRRFILSAFRIVTETYITSIESAWVVEFTDQQRNLLYKTFANVYSQISPIALENLEKKIYVVINEDGKNEETIVKQIPAEIVIKGQSMPGKDVAILKMNSGKELPTITLSDSENGRVGEDVYVYGFPAAVSNNEYLSEETLMEPTLTKGIISAWKKTTRDWPVIQMDANINHGNSGGPMCNERGEVIGITTFGSLDDNARTLAPGLNFAIPVGVLREFLESISVIPEKSKISGLFGQGLMMYDRSHYHKALKLFENVEKINAAYPGINSYIDHCVEHIKSGDDREPGILSYMGISLAIVGAAGFFYFTWRRKTNLKM